MTHKLVSKVLVVFLGTLLANLLTLWALGVLDFSSSTAKLKTWLQAETFDEMEGGSHREY